MARQCPRVDIADSHDAVAAEVTLQGLATAPGAGRPRRFPDDEACHLRMGGLFVLVVGPVVADQRVGHGDQLTRVRRVRQHLLVAGHGGVETTSPIAVPRAPSEMPLNRRRPRAGGRRVVRNRDRLRTLLARALPESSSPLANPHEHRDRRGAGPARRDERAVAALLARGATQKRSGPARMHRRANAGRALSAHCPQSAGKPARAPRPARRDERAVAALLARGATQSGAVRHGCIAGRMPGGLCLRTARSPLAASPPSGVDAIWYLP